MKIRKRVITLVLVLFIPLAISRLWAQSTLQLFSPEKPRFSAFSGAFSPTLSRLLISPLDSLTLRPAIINPDPDYLSFLCRKELEIENALPLGIWIQAGESNSLLLKKPGTGAVTSFRLKLLRF